MADAAEDKFASDWPKLYYGNELPACTDVLGVARRAFLSPAEWVFEAAAQVPASDTQIILAPTERSDSFLIDSGFTEVRQMGSSTVFLHKYSSRQRFVVRQTPFNSNGDFYGLYLVPSSATPDMIADMLKQADRDNTGDVTKVFTGWQRPWLIYARYGAVAIDTKEPWDFLADWFVYVEDKNRVGQPICKMAFRPDVRNAVDLLPAGPLREFAELADEILGPPSPNEGTLNPTARIRSRARNALANLMERPWAIKEPYNSTREVDENLTRWAEQDSFQKEQYDRLKAVYPQALLVLTQHYTSLNKSESDAAALARQSLERVLGTHFVFHKTH